MTRAGLARAIAGFGLAVSLASLALQAPLTVTKRMAVAGATAIEGLAFFTSFFTIWTNALVVVTLAAVLGLVGGPLRSLAKARVFTGAVLAILLVAAVYHLLLSGLRDLKGLEAVSDFGLHSASPAIMLTWWIVQPDHGRLTPRDPLLWTLWPLGYLAFALGQSLSSGWLPYPFLDHFTLGWLSVIGTCALIAGAFVIAGYLVYRLDRLLAATWTETSDDPQ